MNRKKVLIPALCGTLLLSAGGTMVAADEVSEASIGKENMLTVLSSRASEMTQEHARKMSALVKAAVEVAKAEEKAQEAAKAAAAEEKERQEKAAEEKARQERVVAEQKAKEEAEKRAQRRAEGYVPAAYVEKLYSGSTTEQTAPYVEKLYSENTTPSVSVSTYTAPAPTYSYDTGSYAAAPYIEPLYAETTYAEPVYTDTTVYSVPEVTYEEPVYNNYVEPVYTEDAAAVNTEDTTSYDNTAYAEETTYYEDASYVEEPVYDTYSEDTSASSSVRATASSSDLDLLASIIYCEAGGESYEGQVAVGAVVLNRMESSLYPDSMEDVIYQPWQFTPAMTGWLDQVLESGAPDYCYEAAQAALDGENPVGDLLYFHAGGGDGLTIGNQTFY